MRTSLSVPEPEDKYDISALDRSNPESIFHFSRFLIGHTLHALFGDEAVSRYRKGKGGLGQMVEELFFQYEVNGKQEADFNDAGVELKCTPLLKTADGQGYRIKERLVCTMIDYFKLVDTEFEDSHLLEKCRVMLLLFYLHVKGVATYDYEFLFRILWQLPEKDLIQIRNDYNLIVEKVRRGEAHLLSEGDTLYLGAARKGSKGDNLQSQPFSETKAKKRAFSLKPAYMRYVLTYVTASGNSSYSNYTSKNNSEYQLVTEKELISRRFEDIIVNRFRAFYGLDFIQICEKLGIESYQAKNKYADVAGLIASQGMCKRVSNAEEFVKSGIIMKTIRLRPNGMPKEAMSFKNIDYQEVFENDDWLESELYELFTNRFMFVVFRPRLGEKITIQNKVTGKIINEDAYEFDKVFFWTMPPEDLEDAKNYWEHIRENVVKDKIQLKYFWNISDHKKFHVRPKARKKVQLAVNPNGGECERYGYWFNADYVKSIIDSNENIQ